MWTERDCWRAPAGDFPPRWASAWGDDRHGLWADLTVDAVTQRMRWIEPTGPKGFMMGSDLGEQQQTIRAWEGRSKQQHRWSMWSVMGQESPKHAVVLSEGFWLADTPCTQAMWMAVTSGKRNPSEFQGLPDSDRRPVESVSWHDVDEKFLVGLATHGLGLESRQIGLPTEAEWEYACRAGTSTAYAWGNEFDGRHANVDFSIDSGIEPTAVKGYPPNDWGLFDMHGNVFEWCADFERTYPDFLVTDPSGLPAGSHTGLRMARGGSWIYEPPAARSAARFAVAAAERVAFIGFRFLLRSPR